MAITREAPSPTSSPLDEIQLSDVSSDQLAPLLDMMQEFNALEDIPWSRQDAEPAVLRLLDSPELGVVAHILEGGALRGYVVLTWGYDLEWGGRDAFMTDLYLLPVARGRGLGRRALPLIEELARRRGAHALHLMVRPENQAALQLYRGAGYSSPPRAFLTKDLSG